jgi:predicted DNA-binding transcriptional regulator AlpA
MVNIHDTGSKKSDKAAADKAEFYFVLECAAKLGICRTMLHYLSSPKTRYFDPSFPAKRQLWGRRVGYYKHEVDAWIANRPAVHS